MCNAPQDYFFPISDAKRISRNKLHKYLIREKCDEKVTREITGGSSCLYQRTVNGFSSLFLAIAKRRENTVKKLMEIYENDFKVLSDNGYKDDLAVLIAFGADEKAFVDEKLTKLSSDEDDEVKSKLLILIKEKNESPGDVKTVLIKNSDDRKILLELIERLHINGTFDINIRNSHNETLFYVACSQGELWMVEKLLELGSKMDTISSTGLSPFEVACKNNKLEIVKWFHKKFQPDLLKTLTQGSTLFTIASNGSFDVFDYIMTEVKKFDGDEHVEEIFSRTIDYQNGNVLIQAINNDKFDFVLKCLKYNPNLYNVEDNNESILHALLNRRPTNKELVKILIEKHPKLLIMEDSNQWTPLHLLATQNLLDELKSIYEKFPSTKNAFFKGFADTPTTLKQQENIWCETSGHNVLKNLVIGGYLKMAEFIIDNHPNEFDSASYISELIKQLCFCTEFTPATAQPIDFIKKLQKLKYFDINVPDNAGNFVLITALKEKKFDLFKYLLELCDNKDLNKMLDPWMKVNLLYFAIWRKPIDIVGVPYTECCLPNDPDSSDDETEAVAADVKSSSWTEMKIEDPEATRAAMFEIFKDLISRGVDYKLKGHTGASLLITAVDHDNIEVVEELLKLGLPVDDLDANSYSPLHVVKSIEVLKALTRVNSSPEFINRRDLYGRTAFIYFVALFESSKVPMEIFDEFIKLKADINIADNNGLQPIHEVSTEEWVKILLQHGADINAVNNSGENVVHLALRTHKWKLARFLLLNTEVDRFAVNHNEVSYIGYVTMGNVNYNEIFDGELKPVFNELVDKFMNGKTLYGGRQINAFINQADLSLIANPKADLHQTEADGQTCLHRAIHFNTNLQVVKVLVERGIDINAVNETGFTPLMFSIDHNATDVSLFLIEQEKINLDLSNVYGFTALHYAARNDNIKVLCKLLSAGADSSVLTNENQTFYDFLSDFDKKLFSSYVKAN